MSCLEEETKWNPAESEEALRRWLDTGKKFFSCSGCRSRSGEVDDDEQIIPEKPECTSVDNATALDVLNAVCIAYSITVTDIQGTPQSGRVAAARRHAIWLLNKECHHSVGEAGNVVFRDSKTARQAIAVAESIIAGENPRTPPIEFIEKNNQIISLLGGKREPSRG